MIASSTDGYLSQQRSYQGIRFIGQAEFVGDNRGTDVMISVWVKPEEEKTSERDADMKKSKRKDKSEEDKPKEKQKDSKLNCL